jgi:hypothetical protein
MATSTPSKVAKATPITVAHGDGIGPEIMGASLHILKAAGPLLDIDTIEAGEKVYLSGNTSGITPSIVRLGFEVVMTTSLRNYDGKAGFPLAQGQ